MIFPDRKLLRVTCVVRRCMGDLILCALCEWYAKFGINPPSGGCSRAAGGPPGVVFSTSGVTGTPKNH